MKRSIDQDHDYGYGHCRCGHALNLSGETPPKIYCFGCGNAESGCACRPFSETPHEFGHNLWRRILPCVICALPTMHDCYRCDVGVCTLESCRDEHARGAP